MARATAFARLLGAQFARLSTPVERAGKSRDQSIFIAEMAKLFPDHFFHIGGDEVNGKQWDANAKIQEFKKSHDLKDNAALQSYFSKKVQAIVTKHGKRMEGFREHLVSHGIVMSKNVTRHSFVSYHLAKFENAGKTALEAGHTEEMLFKHYRAVATHEAGVEYFDIWPDKTPASAVQGLESRQTSDVTQNPACAESGHAA